MEYIGRLGRKKKESTAGSVVRGNKRERMEEKRMAARQRETERTTENKTATDWTRTDGRGRV